MDTGLPPPPSYSATTELLPSSGVLTTNHSNSSNFQQFTVNKLSKPADQKQNNDIDILPSITDDPAEEKETEEAVEKPLNDEETKQDYNNDDKNVSLDAMNNGILPFNVFYEDLKHIKLSSYSHGIPSGLEGLKQRLIDSNGLNFEGIFRLRGNEKNLNHAKNELNSMKNISALNVTPIEMAQLIKAWYRNLPCDEPGYLSNELLSCSNENEIIHSFNNLSEPRKSLLLWTFDLWIKIEEFKPKNKMTLQSMSIVFSPNMVRCSDPNPMIFLEIQKKVQRVIMDAAKLRKEKQLIINNNNYNLNNNIVPFKIDRTQNNNNDDNGAPKYSPYHTNNNNNNNNDNAISEFFKSCILL